jgi:hypothetical protein
MATRTQNVLGEKGRRIRELTSLVQVKKSNSATRIYENITFRNDSTTPRAALNCTPRRFKIAVCAQSHNASHCATNWSAGWPFVVHVMVCCDSLWKVAPKDAK